MDHLPPPAALSTSSGTTTWGRGRSASPAADEWTFTSLTAGIDIYLEVKGASLVRDSVAFFPDAPTTRGTRRAGDLMAIAGRGVCGSVLFMVQREDARELRPNDETDPAFAGALRLAFRKGLEVLAYTCVPSLEGLAGPPHPRPALTPSLKGSAARKRTRHSRAPLACLAPLRASFRTPSREGAKHAKGAKPFESGFRRLIPPFVWFVVPYPCTSCIPWFFSV